MEERQKRNYKRSNSYVEGNAARKLYVLPEYEGERTTREIPRELPKKRNKPKRNPSINFATFLTLTAAIGVTIYASVDYLTVQSQMTILNKEVSSLQSDYISLRSDNNEKLTEINSKIDLEAVFDTAVTDLGMVFPNNNEIISYESAVSEYVRQYNSIPEATADELLEKFRK